jgi:hypothetical protein
MSEKFSTSGYSFNEVQDHNVTITAISEYKTPRHGWVTQAEVEIIGQVVDTREYDTFQGVLTEYHFADGASLQLGRGNAEVVGVILYRESEA